MSYEIDYNDERFAKVEADKQEALNEVEQTYGGMINESDSFYQAQIDASKEWAETQSKNQQEQTDFAIEQIEQQKDKAHKDYIKEQSAAYTDYQQQVNDYGVNAEQMAASGMQNSGYSESSKVAMYNTYQIRVATAKASFDNAVLNYNNGIKEAQLQNNSALAEIAYNSLQTQLELGLQGFQYKNSLIIEKANKKTEIDNTYHSRYQDVLNQINTENAMEEQIRQYNQDYAFNEKQFEEGVRQYNQNYEFQMAQFDEQIRQFDEEMTRLKEQDAKDNEYKIQQLELQKAQLEEEKRQYEKSFAEEQRQFNASLAEDKRQFNAKQGSGGVVKGSSGSVVDKGAENRPTFTKYSDAEAYMKSHGIQGETGLKNYTEWTRAKYNNSNSAEAKYSTYEAYVNAYVDYKLSE